MREGVVGMSRCCSVPKATGLLPRPKSQQFRAFSSMESLAIPCRSNGSVTINIHYPSAAPSPSPTVALYLPRGPLLHSESDDASNIAILKSTLPCHIVQVCYRWGETNPFPSPLHDVLAAFDWVVENLLPKRAIARPGRAERAGRLVVCGELIGGQLATSLALSECKAGGVGIVAAAVNSPITDWTELEDMTDSGGASQLLTRQILLEQRKALFMRNEHWFDVFASPALIFRSAGIEVPDQPFDKPFDDMSELARLEREEFFQEQMALSSMSSIGEPPAPPIQQDERIKKRRASRRFPSKALGLRLPSFRITTGESSPLADQAMELAHFMKQSFERQGQAATDTTAYQPVYYVETPGIGLWNSTPAGRTSMFETGSWLANTLSR